MTFPNQLSVLRIILSPIFLFFFLSEDIFCKKISLAVYIIATMTDWYDGWHARRYKSVTKMGVFLDPFADKILTSTAFILFAVLNIMPVWMVICIALRDILITLLRSYDEYKGVTLKTSILAKLKTIFQMTYIFFILALITLPNFDTFRFLTDFSVSFLYSTANYIIALLVTLLTVYTGIAYFFENKTMTKSEIH